MNPRVVSVEVTNKYTLKLAFENDETRLFDASPFLDRGIFKELKDFNYFKQVKVAFGSIEWPHEQDFSKDTLYLLSTPSLS
ncbi:MAG: DUF2442 domain-containing protein [Gammaproteobacteria bacterium]|nr:DUF2442 domain-containing protein [Gammaproteobacteria bacterium]MBT4078328.1 DUF2442 domain-containing protein [Gammaproteobacteria bacterium]MBT4194237.1 DUF2442 domain-containing protein [Gammaproteobacteria bacterium]MBT4451607.1 DUF2442 domain-containing protein [Gammaproteobacteria bacterium]MBT4861919.1 DUF2442 domain-containing protein [Gammaproteobacteria bacterium]